MTDLLFKIRLKPELLDVDMEALVTEIMARFDNLHPGVVEGYTYDRLDRQHLHILMWGERLVKEDE